MTKMVLVPIADGIEEIEAVTIIDVLRRAGAKVIVASVTKELAVAASHGVKLIADKLLQDCWEEFDLIVLPGGMEGAKRLRNSKPLISRLRVHQQEKLLYAAICASPAVVLESHGLLECRKATCHPSVVDQLRPETFVDQSVVVDGNVITGSGPGTAMEFALKLVEMLFDAEKAKEVASPMMFEG